MADKPNVKRQVADEDSLNNFVDTLRKSERTPKEKYAFPMTSAQEYGWDIMTQVC